MYIKCSVQPCALQILLRLVFLQERIKPILVVQQTTEKKFLKLFNRKSLFACLDSYLFNLI